ncbi:MAG: FkbM family methyltransferase [Yoonia sp.]|jgi:FkbM family methyltransferase
MTFAHCLDAVEAEVFGLALQIGTGCGAHVPCYAQAGFSDIIIVQPNPEHSADLAAMAARYDQVQVINAALGKGDDKIPFNLLNFPEFSTLKDPEGLSALLPGIRVVDRVLVNTVSVADVCAILPAPNSDKTDVLIIDAPGSEVDIFDALFAEQNLERFGYLAVRCPRELYFEGALTGAGLVQHLAARDFVLLDCDSREDPDWPVYFFRLDVSAVESRKAKKKAAILQADLERANTSNKVARDAHAAALAEVTAQRDAVRQERTKLQADLEEAVVTGKSAQEAHDTALSDLRNQRDSIQSKLDEASKTVQAAETALKTQRSDLALALRMQTIARNDQQELQSRYNDLRIQKKQLEQLLVKLTQKLGSAADHLRLMAAPEDVPVEYDAEDILTAAVIEPKATRSAKAAPRRPRKPAKQRASK